MSVEGIRTACLYSLGCDKMWLHSAPERAEAIMRDFLKGKIDVFVVLPVLKQLEPYNHYKRIAEEYSVDDVFDRRVVRAYWLGYDELDDIACERFHNLIVLEKLKGIMGKGMIENSEAFRLALNCLVSCGEVVETREKEALVDMTAFGSFIGISYTYINICKKVPELVSDIKTGDFVSAHLGFIRERISEIEAVNLTKKTYSSSSICFKPVVSR